MGKILQTAACKHVFFYVHHCQITPSLLENNETNLEGLMWRNEEREQSRAKTSLSRSKSMGSLQNSAGSIGALKALFESKAATQNKVKSSFRAASFTSPYKAADIMPGMNGEVEAVKSSAEEPKTQIPADALVNDAKTGAKEHHATRKVNTIIVISLNVQFQTEVVLLFVQILQKTQVTHI